VWLRRHLPGISSRHPAINPGGPTSGAEGSTPRGRWSAFVPCPGREPGWQAGLLRGEP